MCGLFGVINNFQEPKNIKGITNLVSQILKLSSLRGSEGFGICLDYDYLQYILNEKRSLKSKNILNNLIENTSKSLIKEKKLYAFFGQTRLPTIGKIESDINLVPIKTKNIIGIHNGNILFEELDFSNLEFSPKSDSRLFYEKLDHIYLDDPINFETNLIKFLKNLEGEINIFFKLIPENIFFLYSNTGSIYYSNQINNREGFIFMSEYYFMKSMLKKIKPSIKNFEINNLKKNIIRIDKYNKVLIK